MKKIKRIINKKNKSKIVCLTAYSKNIAEEVDKYVDIVLVGDSLGSVLYNYSTTRKVTLTEMINHSKSARLGVKKSLMVVDMPFNTYATKNAALKNAKKIIKETKCDAVKLEGGKKIINQIKDRACESVCSALLANQISADISLRKGSIYGGHVWKLLDCWQVFTQIKVVSCS